MNTRQFLVPLFATILLFSVLPISASKAAFSAREGNNNLDNFPDAPGDVLSFDGSPTTLVAGVGVNSAYGQFRCQFFGCQDHYDSFRLEVPVGLRIIRTEFSTGDSANVRIPEEVHIFRGPADGKGIFIDPQDTPNFIHPPLYQNGSHIIRLFDFPDPANTAQLSNLILGAGFYDIVVYNFNFVDTADEWELRFITTSVVPLAPTLWFFGAALAGLATLKRRRLSVSLKFHSTWDCAPMRKHRIRA